MQKREYRSLKWQEWYQLAREYYVKNGNLLVPGSYITSDGYRLGRWIERQRYAHRYARHRLTDQKIMKLESIGMVWKLENRFTWEYWLSLCEDYYREHHHLKVPHGYCFGDIHFGYWIIKQRTNYKHGALSQKQIADLERFDMQWNLGYIRHTWDEWFHIAKKHYQEHECLNVPVSYCVDTGEKLGQWLSIQRMRYHGTKLPALSCHEIRLLESIGIVWNR